MNLHFHAWFFFFLMTLVLFTFISQGKAEITNTPVDLDATAETKALLFNLIDLSKQGIMFGHQDDLAYGVYWWAVPGKSDIKSICGDYPAVYGWEIGKIEIGSSLNLDGVNFNNLRGWILEAYNRGGINTISWHSTNPVSGGNAWDTTPAVKHILPGGSRHEAFKARLDRVADFLASLKTEDGNFIPIIFRPYHEHTGNWFWWGASSCTREEYIQLWQFTVEYLRDVRGLHHLLYAYSPASFDQLEEYLDRYPGDEYVDILGLDDYNAFAGGNVSNGLRMLRMIVELADSKQKVAALTELGLNLNDNKCWTKFFDPVKKDSVASRISYFLVWRNASPTHFFAPYPGHASVPDFVSFYNDPQSIFERNLPDMYSISGDDSLAPEITKFPETEFISYNTPVRIEIETDEPAFLRYDFSDLPFEQMANRFDHGEGTLKHWIDFPAEHGRSYTFFIRAADVLGNAADHSVAVTFSVDTTKEEIFWYEPRYNRQNWKIGTAPLGFGNSEIASSVARVNALYLVREFDIPEPNDISYMAIILKYDNGAAIYLNGREIERINLPQERLHYETFALGQDMGIKSIVLGETERALLESGKNLLAVEVHRSKSDSLDLFFDLKLITSERIFDLGSDWQYFDEGTEPAVQIRNKTSVDDSRGSFIPKFHLHPNYPNPFNQSTFICFEIAQKKRVDIKIYDLSGRLVKNLVNQEFSPGLYQIQWNGTNYSGEIVASGAYLIKVIAGNQNRSGKAIFLK